VPSADAVTVSCPQLKIDVAIESGSAAAGLTISGSMEAVAPLASGQVVPEASLLAAAAGARQLPVPGRCGCLGCPRA
jgi:hypothetical protein